MVVPWLYHGGRNTMVVPWIYMYMYTVAPWMYYNGFIMVVHRVIHGCTCTCTMVVQLHDHGCTMVVPWMWLFGCTMELWLYHRLYTKQGFVHCMIVLRATSLYCGLAWQHDREECFRLKNTVNFMKTRKNNHSKDVNIFTVSYFDCHTIPDKSAKKDVTGETDGLLLFGLCFKLIYSSRKQWDCTFPSSRQNWERSS